MRVLLAGLTCLLGVRSVVAADAFQAPQEEALQIEAVYTGEIWRQAAGGIATGTRYLDNLDLTIDVDGASLLGLEGSRMFVDVLYNNGHEISSDLSGAAQGISNIEATSAVRLFEFWFEQSFGAEQDTVRLGIYDLNSEFDAIDAAGVFVNPSRSMGAEFSQTGRNGPSISPVTGLALRAVKSFGAWSAQAAILDGVPGDPRYPDRTTIRLSGDDGALIVTELNYRAGNGARVGGGYWRYTARFDDLLAETQTGLPQRNDNAGEYFIVESPALLARGEERELRLFARIGAAESRINPIDEYFGAGIVSRGMLASRWPSEVGLAISIAELGHPAREALRSSGLASTAREYNYELAFKVSVAEWLSLQADVQHIDNPGMDPELASGWVVGMRFETSARWAR